MFQWGTLCFLVFSNRKSGGEAEIACYDLEWKDCSDLLANNKHYIIRKSGLKRPENLESMIEYAKILANPFPQVRVDFYDIEGKTYFGELTFTSLGGMMNYFTQEALNDMGENKSFLCWQMLAWERFYLLNM